MLVNESGSQHSLDQLVLNDGARSPVVDSRLNRLPTLYEVFNRQTDSPVDLWSFYVYMRDYQNAVDYLDFWIDAITHLRLCKDYVRGLRESLIISEKHKSSSSEKNKNTSSDTDNNAEENRKSVTSSLLLDALLNEGLLDDTDNRRVSNFLQGHEFIRNSDPRISEIFGDASQRTSLVGSNDGIATSKRGSLRVLPEQLEKYVANVKSGNITRATLKSSSKNIVNTYFQENSSKKLIIPDRIVRKIKHDVELQGRDDPDVFEDAKNYIYSAMERDSFTYFLQKNCLHNLNYRSCLYRLILGLFSFFAAFWISYTLIFVNVQPKAIRAVILVPFFLGTYLILTFLYKLDPLMVFLRYSDNPELRRVKTVKRRHFLRNLKEPFVVKLLQKRSLWVLFLACVISAAFSVLFGLVPGHRI
ncbi:Rax1p CYBJADRAFT_129143 [Cyberlindnera jadinii NRRL Y-1542]|uniref:RGS domain-containing protein n=1 Tax=Cyberlindnera jadinii (strain ATCC 18201 / CBS 1600 / BCRC 20928 / JCM 3617 / NBRC 0987 / NRRL Y-1542) TaxID=983966 RepID=A0A1E4RZ69_CYBJN|nr:hypothetical protein CYBJADRAFT_129143 [Cyberlindnera jadinii NRRL Y-1542]ODV72556.1 hypothetical protein CYBJADRAFT_129143 [Cyberlindnera jadinii NRRL Y-1542]